MSDYQVTHSIVWYAGCASQTMVRSERMSDYWGVGLQKSTICTYVAIHTHVRIIIRARSCIHNIYTFTYVRMSRRYNIPTIDVLEHSHVCTCTHAISEYEHLAHNTLPSTQCIARHTIFSSHEQVQRWCGGVCVWMLPNEVRNARCPLT